jgi:hypothetical protein
MDERLVVGTVYAPDGRRIGIEVGDDEGKLRVMVTDLAKGFGQDYTFKVWECREVVTVEDTVKLD